MRRTGRLIFGETPAKAQLSGHSKVNAGSVLQRGASLRKETGRPAPLFDSFKSDKFEETALAYGS